MDPEKQRIAIAEACGWRILTMREAVEFGLYKTGGFPMDQDAWQFLYDGNNKKHAGTGFRNKEYGGWVRALPDYLGDLNAMHEAEKLLDDGVDDAGSLRYRYAGFLYHITVPQNLQPFRATAPQRAEALLRTLNLWEEE